MMVVSAEIENRFYKSQEVIMNTNANTKTRKAIVAPLVALVVSAILVGVVPAVLLPLLSDNILALALASLFANFVTGGALTCSIVWLVTVLIREATKGKNLSIHKMLKTSSEVSKSIH